MYIYNNKNNKMSPSRKNNKRKRQREPETDIIIWPTDEEVYEDVKHELETEECICVDDEIADTRMMIQQIKEDISTLKNDMTEIIALMKSLLLTV